MRKFISFVCILAGFLFCVNAEEVSKEEDIDNVYSIEWTLDTDTSLLRINLFALNTDAYDEAFGDECIEEELKGILSDYGYTESYILSTIKDDNFKDKYTKVEKKYKLVN